MPPSDLTRIIPVLTDLAQHNQQPLRKIATTCDLQLECKAGTSLKVAYYLLVTRQWVINMFQPIVPGEPLSLLQVDLRPFS